MAIVSRAGRRSRDRSKASVPAGTRVYAIGDSHGCADRLDVLHEMILEDSNRADAAGPAALISIGLFMAAHPIRIVSATVIVPTLLKVGLFPVIVWLGVTYLFPLDGMWAALAVLMAAAPLGAIAFVISHRYKAAREETSATILLSTILALPILSLIVSSMVER